MDLFFAYYYELHFDHLLQTLSQQVHGVNRSRFASVHQHDYSSFNTTHRTCRLAGSFTLTQNTQDFHCTRDRNSLIGPRGHRFYSSLTGHWGVRGARTDWHLEHQPLHPVALSPWYCVEVVLFILFLTSKIKKIKDIKIGQKKSEEVENFSVNLLLKTTLHSHLRLTLVLFGVFIPA